jgi:SNF2 family DNA or RNA helicase
LNEISKIEVLPINSRELGIKFRYDPILVEKIKALPQRRWDREKKVWAFMPSVENIKFIQTWFPSAQWSKDCETFRAEAMGRNAKRMEVVRKKQTGDIDLSIFDKVPFKLPPKSHQKVALALGQDATAFAYLMDQGTGKTKTLIDDAAHNFRLGRIDAMLVIAPNSVKTNWVDPDGGEDEISKHMPPDINYVSACWVSSPSQKQRRSMEEFEDHIRAKKKKVLKVFVVNIEAIAFDRCFEWLQRFCKTLKVFITVDESTRIKHRTAQRTKAAFKLRKLCEIARIASGTPVIKSPLNAYAQFYFLDPEILGFSNYRSFEARYGVKGGYEGREILFYQNLEELQDKIDSASYRVLKDDCLDLDPKIYQKRHVPLTSEQKHYYNALREESIVAVEEALERGENKRWIEANIVLTKYLRLQQITSGFLPLLDGAGQAEGYVPFGKMPPKIAEAIDIIEECQGKVIVWCRFIPEIRMMEDALNAAGIRHVTFHGGIAEKDRVTARTAFQSDGSGIDVFVGQVQTGGVGITLNKARTVIYLSNTFNTEDRVQSEDRAHRIGTAGSVTYIDLICPGTIDAKVIQCLRENKRLSDMIMKDGIREWI